MVAINDNYHNVKVLKERNRLLACIQVGEKIKLWWHGQAKDIIDKAEIQAETEIEDEEATNQETLTTNVQLNYAFDMQKNTPRTGCLSVLTRCLRFNSLLFGHPFIGREQLWTHDVRTCTLNLRLLLHCQHLDFILILIGSVTFSINVVHRLNLFLNVIQWS